MNKAGKLLLILSLLGLYAVTPALADVPTKMNVQGRLTNGSGGVVPAGLKNFTFKIFDQQVGGTEIWPAAPGETQTLVTDANGLWSGSIGQLIPLTETVFQSPVRWLEVTVNDGVNPPETLPRVELKTNPYTYRAASSQQADSLAGSSLSDLTNKFVDVSGDDMSGPLTNSYTQKDVGTSIQIDNFNDVAFQWWNDLYGTWGLSSDVSGDGNNWNIGVAAAARGNNNVLEANRGVLAYADGTGSVNIGVEASTGMTGSANFSGYFHAGDFLVGSTQTLGTGGVLLPADAIDNTEILDEPGIASQNLSDFTVPSSNTMEDVTTVTITTTAAGWIHVRGSAYGWVEGAVGDNAIGHFQIDEDAGGSNTPPYYRAFGEYGKPTAMNEFTPLYCERIYFKAPGTYTFRMEAARGDVSGIANIHVGFPILTATYFSTSYGAVSTVLATSDAGEFENLTPVAQNPVGADGQRESHPQVLSYQVDLRELELKVARAEAEVERARRELVEAKVKVGHSSSAASGTAAEEHN